MTRCSTCGKPSVMSDLDLAPIARTEANLWKSKYFEAWRELQKANRGLRRLAMKIQRLKSYEKDAAMNQRQGNSSPSPTIPKATGGAK